MFVTVEETTKDGNWRNCGEGRARRRAEGWGSESLPERTTERADSGSCSAATGGGRGEAGNPAEDPRCPPRHQQLHGAETASVDSTLMC